MPSEEALRAAAAIIRMTWKKLDADAAYDAAAEIIDREFRALRDERDKLRAALGSRGRHDCPMCQGRGTGGSVSRRRRLRVPEGAFQMTTVKPYTIEEMERWSADPRTRALHQKLHDERLDSAKLRAALGRRGRADCPKCDGLGYTERPLRECECRKELGL